MKKVESIVEQINAQYGKLPPRSIEVEEAVLGAMILERDAYANVASIIQPESFYKDEHQKICAAIKAIHESNKHVDLVQVTTYLRDHDQIENVGGMKHIMELTRHVTSAAHIEFHARIIAQKYLRRELIRISSELQNKSYDETIDEADLIGFVHEELKSLESNTSSPMLTPADGVSMVYDKIKANLEKKDGIVGFPTGFKEIDEFSGGLQTTDLVIIAAESGQGKTSLMLSIFRSLALLNEPVSVISFEMSFIQLIARLISQSTDIPGKRILNHKLTNSEIANIDSVVDEVSALPFYIIEHCSNKLTVVLSMITHVHLKYGVRIFGIDYLQLMDIKDNKASREEKLGTITRELKNIAKELDVLVIALSQLRRGDSKEGHVPSLNRLRGSGQIEEAADIVAFIYRPEEFDEDYIDDVNYLSSKGKAIIDIAKGRNIGTGKFIVNFRKESGLFYDNASFDDFKYNPDGFHEAEREEF